MINDIIKSVGPEVLSKFTGQFGMSDDQASKALEVTRDSLESSVTKEVGSGNFDGLLSLVNRGSGASGTGTFQKIAGNLTSDFISKLGIPSGVANQITSFVLPFVLDKIVGKTGGKASKSDLMKMAGGSAADLLKNKAGGLLGGLFK